MIIDIINKKYNDMLYDTRPVKLSELLSNKYNVVHKQIYNKAIEAYIDDWFYVKKLIADNEYLKTQIYEYGYEYAQQVLRKINHNKSYINKHIDDKQYLLGKRYFKVNNKKEFKINSYIYEIPNNEYWQPSKCVIITKAISVESPNLRWTVDLTPYWNFYQEKKEKDIENLKMDINENIGDSEIIGFNYLTGKAKLYSENLNKTYEIDFDYLDGNKNKISDDFLLSKTFSSKLSR